MADALSMYYISMHSEDPVNLSSTIESSKTLSLLPTKAQLTIDNLIMSMLSQPTQKD